MSLGFTGLVLKTSCEFHELIQMYDSIVASLWFDCGVIMFTQVMY